MEPDWSSLPTDMLVLIAGLFTLMEDFMAFRGVCTSWRAAAIKDKCVSKIPLLMLSEEEGTDVREFYSLSKRKICMRLPFPDAKGKKCCHAGFGWILTWGETGEVCLSNPTSSSRFQLPSFKTFPIYNKMYCVPAPLFIRRAWLTANPSKTSNFTLMVLMSKTNLGFWRDGDEYWTKVKHRIVNRPVLTCHKGVIYILDLNGNMFIWDPQEIDLSNPEGQRVSVRNGPCGFGGAWQDYLVVSTDGELLVITRNNTCPPRYVDTGANYFRVMKLDRSKGQFIEISDLGKDAIFIGDNAEVSVDATEFPGVLKPNCIYFTDDVYCNYLVEKYCPNGGGQDMGIYHVEDRSIERFDVESYSRLCSPLWMFPSF